MQQVSWLPDRPRVDLPARLCRVDTTNACSGFSTFVPGYSGGGRAGFSPASLLSGALRCSFASWWSAPTARDRR